jgi:hypothetical protein
LNEIGEEITHPDLCHRCAQTVGKLP